MFFAEIPRHTRQNAITEGDSECILTRNCEGTEQLRRYNVIRGASVGEKGILYENNTDNPEYSVSPALPGVSQNTAGSEWTCMPGMQEYFSAN